MCAVAQFVNNKEKDAAESPRLLCQLIDDLLYCCVFKVGRPALGPCIVGITVKGACRVKFSTVSEGSLIC